MWVLMTSMMRCFFLMLTIQDQNKTKKKWNRFTTPSLMILIYVLHRRLNFLNKSFHSKMYSKYSITLKKSKVQLHSFQVRVQVHVGRIWVRSQRELWKIRDRKPDFLKWNLTVPQAYLIRQKAKSSSILERTYKSVRVQSMKIHLRLKVNKFNLSSSLWMHLLPLTESIQLWLSKLK